MRENEKKGGRVLWIELLRVFCIFGVVMVHMASLRVKDASLLYDRTFSWLSLYHSLPRFCVCCFVMISGALLLNPKKRCSIKDNLRHRVKKMAVLYLFWSLVYTAVYTLRLIQLGREVTAGALWEHFLFGHYHLWFLLMLIGLYLLTPVLQTVVNHGRNLEYLLVLCAVTYFLPNMLRVFPQLYEGLNRFFVTKMAFYPVRGYIGYYLLGYYLSTRRIPGKVRALIYALGLLCIWYGVRYGIDYSRQIGKISQYPYDNITLNIAVYSAAVFLFFKYELGERGLLERFGGVITTAGSYTLGIYILHALLIDSLGLKLYDTFGLSRVWLLVPAGSVLIFALSYLATACLKRVPGVGRWLL